VCEALEALEAIEREGRAGGPRGWGIYIADTYIFYRFVL
jgi:hypothetical protein